MSEKSLGYPRADYELDLFVCDKLGVKNFAPSATDSGAGHLIGLMKKAGWRFSVSSADHNTVIAKFYMREGKLADGWGEDETLAMAVIHAAAEALGY